MSNIEDIIDKILNEDLENISVDKLIGIITGGQTLSDIEKSYQDIQTEEGFNKELENTRTAINAMVESLKPVPLPISEEKIDDLSCNFSGDDLYSNILLECSNQTDPSLLDGLDLDSIKDENGKIASKLINSHLEKKDPGFKNGINESIFDNIDPSFLGQPSNIGTRKIRKTKVLGYDLEFECIISKPDNTPVYYKIKKDFSNNKDAKKNIKKVLDSIYSNSSGCDFKDFAGGVSDEDRDNDLDREDDLNLKDRNLRSPNPINDDGERMKNQLSSYIPYEDNDALFFPDGVDPLINADCDPVLTEDPITGDVILTEEAIQEIIDQNEFCDPEPDAANNAEDIVAAELDVDPGAIEFDTLKIESCIDEAIKASSSIEFDVKNLARWQVVSNYLEEIYYHYDVIFEYQSKLKQYWEEKEKSKTFGPDKDLGSALSALMYDDKAKDIERQILYETKDYDYYISTFLETVTIFNKNLFLVTTDKLEADEDELRRVFNSLIDQGKSPIVYNDKKNKYDIKLGIAKFQEYSETITLIFNKRDFINELNVQRDSEISQRDSYISKLSSSLNKTVNINDIPDLFELKSSIIEQGAQRLINEAIFVGVPGSKFGAAGHVYKEELKEFSARFTDLEFDGGDSMLKFELTLMTDLGSPMPRVIVEKPGKFSLFGQGSPIQKVLEIDTPKVRIGHEYDAKDGILKGFPTDYLKTCDVLKIKNRRSGQKDATDFYNFVDEIINTNKSKNRIIEKMVDDHGVLYGRLIEVSASPWLFFSAAERGDNNERDPSKTRPSSFAQDGQPNEVFKQFFSNYKKKWDAKYNQNKEKYINPKINDVKKAARKAASAIVDVLPDEPKIGARIYQAYYDLKKRIDQIQDIILLVNQKSEEVNKKLSPDNLKKRFSNIKCAQAAEVGDNLSPGQDGDGLGNENADSGEKCPPPCCGPAGSDFKGKVPYLISSPPSSDCPTMYQKCWWKQFAKDLTIVGLLPYPNGIPPIESAKDFLTGGPSVRLGLKYWPVGYIPPAFIPIPIPNPVDGQPYIRIPLPMIYNIINPIVIPLPFNLGVLVIFIPFIGGFMPTPLVYIKEFLFGNSLFITGLRGPRFIPRKCDPSIKDPLEKFKQALTFGIPDKLIDLPNFGLDNLDSPFRIMKDLSSHLGKIVDSIKPPSNLGGLRNVQQSELEIRNKIEQVRKDYEKKSALYDIPKPDLNQFKNELSQITEQRKETMKSVISQYIDTTFPTPKDIHFPKDKNNLKIDIPGFLKSIRILRDMKASKVPYKCEPVINFKEDMKEVLHALKIITPPEYLEENIGVSNQNQIFLRRSKDPRLMSKEEFEDLVKQLKGAVIVIAHILMRGNRISVIRKIRKGVFSEIDFCEYDGKFSFPLPEITLNTPKPLKFKRKRIREIRAMYRRIMSRMASTQYTAQELLSYVRYNGEDAQLVIRVKDLKKMVSKKMGLSKRKPNEPERPIDPEEPLISNFPHPEGTLCCLESLNKGFGDAVSAFELPTVFPLKQGQISQIQGLGGKLEITIKGSEIKEYIKKSVIELIDNGKLEEIFPEIKDPMSPKFINLNAVDLQKLSRSLITETFNPKGAIPPIMAPLSLDNMEKSRPTSIGEQIAIGMGVPPVGRIPLAEFWKYFKGVPKTPLGEKIINEAIRLAAKILDKLPWPIVALIGRQVVNLINPLVITDDHPVWRRMSLKNVYYVIYLDEFLRSAADVSGLFKYFLGATGLDYPIPQLSSEFKKAFKDSKKY